MRKAYYIEWKTYSHTHYGYEFQLADGGEMPRICGSKKRAIERAKSIVAHLNEKSGYDVVIPKEENPAAKGNCLYAVRLTKEGIDMRAEIRVYEFYYD